MQAVIFDLDGVIVSTDHLHYEAWLKVSQEEGLVFNHDINSYLRGVSREASLDIILTHNNTTMNSSQKQDILTRKNNYYLESIQTLTPEDMLDGIPDVLSMLKDRKLKLAIGSSSKNAQHILKQIGLSDFFDSVCDGTMIINSKPDPEVFLLAANMLGVQPEDCVVIEDASSGVEAAVRANMIVYGVGEAVQHNDVNGSLFDFIVSL